MRNTTLLNEDGVEVLKRYNKPNVCAFIDPPYPHETRKPGLWHKDRNLDWSEEQQRELLKTLDSFKGKFILTQRKLSPEIKKRIKAGKWHAKRVKTWMSLGTGGSAPKQAPEHRYEYVIANFPLTPVRKSHSLNTTRFTPIIKADLKKRIVYGITLEPGTVDAQLDVADEDEIERAQHLYLAKHRKVGVDHKRLVPDCYPVESFVAPQDLIFEFNGQRTKVKKGTGIVGIYVGNDEVWEGILNGKYRGLSITGRALRIPVSSAN